MGDKLYESGEWEILVDDLDPLKRTESTTKRVGHNDDIEDNCKIRLKQFHAKCYCDALRQSNKAQGFNVYDMYFCKEDKASGWELCPNFEELSNVPSV